MTHRTIVIVASVVLAAACAPTTPGASPHDTSATGHQRAADEHQMKAASHASRYDSHAAVSKNRCGAGTASRDTFDVCWTSTVNPTEEHLEHAELHRKHAADHSAASAELRAAEGRACAGIAADDRDMSPFAHTQDIVGTEPLTEPAFPSDLPGERLAGAVITFRAVRGMTAEWLQRTVDCHLARNAALGHAVPHMPDCPLVPRGVTAKVESTGAGFAVTVRSADPATAKAVLARAQRLASGARK